MKIYRSNLHGNFWIEFAKSYYVYDRSLAFLTREPKPVELSEDYTLLSKAEFFDLVSIDYLPLVLANKIFENIDDIINCSYNLHKLLKIVNKFGGIKRPSTLKILNDPHSQTLFKLLNEFYIQAKTSSCLGRHDFIYLETLIRTGFLMKVWNFHKGQVRKFTNEEPYFFHLLRVANSFLEYSRDYTFIRYFDKTHKNRINSVMLELIITCLLHDIIEDTKATGDDVLKIIGNGVCSGINPKQILSNVFTLTKYKNTSIIDYTTNIMNASTEVKLIKLFDILDNISSESPESSWHKDYLMEKHVQVSILSEIKFHDIFFKVLDLIESKLDKYGIKIVLSESMKLDYLEFENDLMQKINDLSSMYKAYYYRKLTGRDGLLSKIKKMVEE